MRQFKTDEASRRAEAQRLKQRLAQLQKQRDRQDLEISRLRESNKKQQSVIQAKDDLLRTYKHHHPHHGGGGGGATRTTPVSGRRSSSGGGAGGGNSSFVAASPGSRRRRRSSNNHASAHTDGTASNTNNTTTAPTAPNDDALDWFQKGVRDVAAQLRAQRLVDDRLEELRAALGQQESKTAERRRVRRLAKLRERVALDQTLGTLGRNLDALQGEADAIVAADGAGDSSGGGAVQELDEELDAIGVDVAHLRQAVAAAQQQVRPPPLSMYDPVPHSLPCTTTTTDNHHTLARVCACVRVHRSMLTYACMHACMHAYTCSCAQTTTGADWAIVQRARRRAGGPDGRCCPQVFAVGGAGGAGASSRGGAEGTGARTVAKELARHRGGRAEAPVEVAEATGGGPLVGVVGWVVQLKKSDLVRYWLLWSLSTCCWHGYYCPVRACLWQPDFGLHPCSYGKSVSCCVHEPTTSGYS